MTGPVIGIATCAAVPDAGEEGWLLRAAFEQRGVLSEAAVWNNPGVDWSRYSAVVIRTVGDYHRDPPRFLRWASTVQARLIPPAQVVAWNIDRQRYLEDLRDAGVQVARTRYVEPDEGFRLPPGRFVVKPAISAGSNQAAVYGENDSDWRRAGAHVRALHDAGRTVMLQPYYDSVDTQGETSLVYIDAQFAGAVRKDAVLKPGPQVGRLPEAVSPQVSVKPDALHEGDLALRFVDGRFGRPLFARVDMLRNDFGVPVVSDVRLFDPLLFLRLLPGAVEGLAAAILRDAISSPSAA